ncbi:MAG: metal ABC transporter permease [Firmicutes bacterium]|nr:metal ABC transporter permease [Bacillota bacterium]
MSLSDIFTDPFILGVFLTALVVGILISLCSSLLGVSLVLKRYSMIGDGLSHVGFGALALATALGLNRDYALELSVPIVIIAAFFILRLSDSSKIKGDSAIALLSTSAVAVGIIIYDFSTGVTTDICSSLFGSQSIITLTTKDLILSVLLSVTVILLFVFSYNRLFAVTFDESFSQATGLNTGLYKMLISVLTAVTVVIGMKMMGAIIISALIIFPALSSMRLCKAFRSVIICSAAISFFCFTVGFIAACLFSLQTGPCVVLANLAVFIIMSVISTVKTKVSKN